MNKIEYEKPEIEVVEINAESNILNTYPGPGGNEGIGGGVDD